MVEVGFCPKFWELTPRKIDNFTQGEIIPRQVRLMLVTSHLSDSLLLDTLSRWWLGESPVKRFFS